MKRNPDTPSQYRKYPAPLMTWVDEPERDKLDAAARQRGISRAELLRQIIAGWLRQHPGPGQ